MHNSLVFAASDTVTISKNDLTMYAVDAAAVLVVIILVVVALKRRKKNFIKTLPTNLKDED